MKALAVLKTVAVTLSAGCLLFGTHVALAQQDDGTEAEEFESRVESQVVGGVPTYRVGYMYSTTTSPRKAMAISITNNSSQSCDTTVRWRAGGGQLIGISSLVIPPGQTLEHCSRTLPGATVVCNVTSNPQVAPPQFTEGKADIHLASACARLVNIDAKQYYMTGSSDTSIAAVHRAATILGNSYQGD
jgi:hypothetical protein